MKTKRIYLSIILTCFFVFPGGMVCAVSRTVDCQGTLTSWRGDVSLKGYMASHNCRCVSSNRAPVCTPKSTGRSGSGPQVGGYGSSNDFALQMMEGLIGGMFANIFAPPQQNNHARQQQLLAQQQEQQRQEALKQQAMAAWQQLRDEEEARLVAEEAGKKQRGRKLLGQMASLGDSTPGRMGNGGGGKLQPFSWDTPQLTAKSIGTGVYDTSGFTSLQRMDCAGYFSRKALEASNSGDDEGARFLNEQADKVAGGEMTDVECKISGLQQLADAQRQNLQENTRLTERSRRLAKMAELVPLIEKKAQHFQEIESKFNGAKMEREAAEEQLAAAQVKVEEAQVSGNTAQTPEEATQADDLLQQALALQDEAVAQIGRAKEAEDEYAKLKNESLTELQKLKDESLAELQKMREEMNARGVNE